MAIAAIVTHSDPSSLQGLKDFMQTLEGRIEINQIGSDRLAATVEAPSSSLPLLLRRIQDFPNVFELELVYVNYEEDLDADGNMPCPPISKILKNE